MKTKTKKLVKPLKYNYSKKLAKFNKLVGDTDSLHYFTSEEGVLEKNTYKEFLYCFCTFSI